MTKMPAFIGSNTTARNDDMGIRAVAHNDVWHNNRANNGSVPIRIAGIGWSGSNVAF